MSTTRDWMRGQDFEAPERPTASTKTVLIWVTAMVLSAFVALAVLKIVG